MANRCLEIKTSKNERKGFKKISQRSSVGKLDHYNFDSWISRAAFVSPVTIDRN